VEQGGVVKPAEFQKYLERDGGTCYHCGKADDTLVPQHRAGRGMGGSKARHRPSNIITLCSYANGLIESSAGAAATARAYGWKIASWADPTVTEVFYFPTGEWFMLDDEFGRVVIQSKKVETFL